MATVYPSKIDRWLAAVLIGTVGMSAWASARILLNEASNMWWPAMPLLGLGTGLPLWIMLDTRYALDATYLRIHSGPFKWRIRIADISAVTPSSSLLSSPALSLDRLHIAYGKGKSILISPRDKERFLRQLETLRRPAA